MSKFKLTKNNYYSQEAQNLFWSASFYKSMCNCQNMAVAEMNGDYVRSDNTALLVGSYVDAFFDGKREFDRFCSEHPEIKNSRTGELKSDFKKANQMIDRAKSDAVFMSYLKGERQKIFTGKIEGVPFRCKMDFYKKGERIVDLKTVKDFEPMYREGEGKVPFASYWRWDTQMAIYQELAFQNTGERLPCYLACITKEDPPALMLVEIPQHILDTEMEVVRSNIPMFDAIRNGIVDAEPCGRCAWCRQSHKITSPISLDEFML